MTPDAAGIEAALAAGLAAHRLIHDDRRRDPFRCTCDKWVAVVAANGRDREGVTIEDQHRAHQAAALLPVVTQAQAEAWDKGYAAFAQQFVTPLRDDGTREAAPNPYRAAQVAPSRVPGEES